MSCITSFWDTLKKKCKEFYRIAHLYKTTICNTKQINFARLPGDSRSPDRLLGLRQLPRWRMNGSGHRRLPLLQGVGMGGGGRGALVLLLDPGDLVVLAGLSRHRGRYLSHLHLRVRERSVVTKCRAV